MAVALVAIAWFENPTILPGEIQSGILGLHLLGGNVMASSGLWLHIPRPKIEQYCWLYRQDAPRVTRLHGMFELNNHD